MGGTTRKCLQSAFVLWRGEMQVRGVEMLDGTKPAGTSWLAETLGNENW